MFSLDVFLILQRSIVRVKITLQYSFRLSKGAKTYGKQ